MGTAAFAVSEAVSQGTLLHSADKRQAEQLSCRYLQSGRGNVPSAGKRTRRKGRRNGSDQSGKPNAAGTEDGADDDANGAFAGDTNEYDISNGSITITATESGQTVKQGNTTNTDTYVVITATMPQNAITIKADVPPYLLGLDPTLYFDRFHLSKYILQLAKIKKLEKALDKTEQNAIINKSPVEGLICECAGIGRQASLRCLCSIGRVGSSPITRTIPLLR